MGQTIKAREYNYYLMSNNDFVKTEEPSTTTNYNSTTLLSQIISVSPTIKQNITIEKCKSEKLVIALKHRSRRQLVTCENTNILQTQLTIQDNIAVEFN